jgi:hypothetical protein
MSIENKVILKKIDKILTELSIQTNIILDGIQKIYSYINDNEVHYIMENMFKSSIELSKYINNLLDYKKYLLDDIKINFTKTNILQLIKNIFNIYNVKMETYNIIFNYNLSNVIRNYTYLIDEKYLIQIIINIIDIIIYDIESSITNINNNKILINIEYNNYIIEFNIYYTSSKDINITEITSNPLTKYNVKYNIINELVRHLKGDIHYYNNLDETISYDKHINFKISAKQIESISFETDNNSLSFKENKTLVILSSNSLYLNIIISALDYYKEKINLNIIPLTNIKKGFEYINKEHSKIDFLILDIEYNDLFGLNILNNLYKYLNMKFILTTSIEIDNIKNYIGQEFENNRIFIYIKPINNHNIKKIEKFLLL